VGEDTEREGQSQDFIWTKVSRFLREEEEDNGESPSRKISFPQESIGASHHGCPTHA